MDFIYILMFFLVTNGRLAKAMICYFSSFKQSKYPLFYVF